MKISSVEYKFVKHYKLPYLSSFLVSHRLYKIGCEIRRLLQMVVKLGTANFNRLLRDFYGWEGKATINFNDCLPLYFFFFNWL